MTPNPTTDDDLLLAVRYALNECDPAELAAFEARLGDDPAAQVALVEAVQIVALLQSTPTCEALGSSRQAASVSRRSVAPSRRSWLVATLLAATLLVAVIAVWQSIPSSRIDHTVAMTNESPALAQAWTTLDSPASTTDEASSVDDSADDSAEEVASDVPDWLLAAVMAEAEQGQPDASDMDLEEETQL